jgi:hypothetical protein
MKDGLVTVTPRDQDRFVIKVRRAIEILRQAARAEQFERQFTLLLRILAQWLEERTDIERAYLTHREGALAFVVVRNSSESDEECADALSDLDFRIANDPDLDLIKMDAIALPLASDSTVSSFLDPSFVFEYIGHGNRSGSPGASQ